LKAWGRELFVELRRCTDWAIGQGIVTHLLQNILGMAAGVAFVSVNGHEESSFKLETQNPQL
jgi:hypothetical protein